MGFLQNLFRISKPKKDASFGIRPSDRVVEEEAYEDDDDWHYIDGKLVYGHFECTDKKCGWYGTENDVESKELYEIITSDGIYTGKRMVGDNVVMKIIAMYICPDCGNHRLIFVPSKTKEVD